MATISATPEYLGQTADGVPFISSQALQPNDGIWDTWKVDLTTAIGGELEFFKIPRGKAGSGWGRKKGYTETNMNFSAKLDYPTALTVSDIVVSVAPYAVVAGAEGSNAPFTAAAANYIASLLEETLLILSIDNDEKYRNHLIGLTSSGITGRPEQVGAAATTLISGNPSWAARPSLSSAIPIPSRRRIQCKLQFSPNAPYYDDTSEDFGLIIRIQLNGVKSRHITK